MSVKTIFKTLIGTIVIMVAGSLVVEMMNLTVVSLQSTNISKLACKQAAILFSQETYKERTDASGGTAGGSVGMSDSLTADATLYVDGNFYGVGRSAEDIYNSIYTSSDFKAWMLTPEVAHGHWKSIDLINRAINNPSSLTMSLPASATDAQMNDYIDSMLAKSYRDVLMTPLNMGVPYLDADILQHMFQWNLAQIASDCNSNAIRTDDSGQYCIYYKGFRVYADEARITNIDYQVFDIDNAAEKQKFSELTHIDTDNLGFDDSLINYMGGYTNDDERKRICVVALEFSVPIAYEGVTPIRNLANFAWNEEVAGLDGNGDNQSVGTHWNDMKADLESGGWGNSTTPAGVLPVPGKLIYYVVR